MRRAIGPRSAPWLVAFALVVLLGLRFANVLSHLGSDFVDFHALHGDRLVFEQADTRLNAWILAWVERAATSAPGTLFDGNIHHPEPGVLTGSEHLLGVALQLLPFEPLIDGAVARHQLALVLSSALLMASSFVVVRWATGSLCGARRVREHSPSSAPPSRCSCSRRSTSRTSRRCPAPSSRSSHPSRLARGRATS